MTSVLIRRVVYEVLSLLMNPSHDHNAVTARDGDSICKLVVAAAAGDSSSSQKCAHSETGSSKALRAESIFKHS